MQYAILVAITIVSVFFALKKWFEVYVLCVILTNHNIDIDCDDRRAAADYIIKNILSRLKR